MRSLVAWLVGRLVPAVLIAGGVAILVAGLLAWTDPTAIGSVGSPAPSAGPVVSGPPATPLPTLQPIPSVGPASSPSAMPAPSTLPTPTPTPTPRTGVATRVVVPALGIDLPVVKSPPDETFPYCDVAEYSSAFSQPGLGGQTFLYAHARDGMFLPILEESKVRDGKAMIGMVVQVYTSDDMVFLYQIADVYRHQDSLDAVFTATGENVFLQTSEGPRAGNAGYTGLVTIVRAEPISSAPADHADAHPAARPRTCS
jgi:hypothetical protein